MFPFIFLLTTQLFFIKLFENKEIEIFKYTGLRNIEILKILSITTFFMSIFIVFVFYNFSSTLKNIYLELKSPYTKDGKYLAVVTKNGLWIKDKVDNNNLLINSTKIEGNYLIGNFITIFNEDFKVIKNIKANKINISDNEWILYEAHVFKNNDQEIKKLLKLKTNFNFERISTLYSNLSALNLLALYELRKNYLNLNYSVTEIDSQFLKILTYPLFLILITLFSSLMMLNIKNIKGTTYKISLGLFFSVIIYYLNNFSLALGNAEKIPLLMSIFIPLFVILFINSIMIVKINEK